MDTDPNPTQKGTEAVARQNGKRTGTLYWSQETLTTEQAAKIQCHGLIKPKNESRLKVSFDDGTSISAEAIGNGSNPDELVAKVKAKVLTGERSQHASRSRRCDDPN
jgi:hypothetical protein